MSVDAAAAAATWSVLVATTMPDAGAIRRWAAVVAATVVTLAAMRLLGLYRSRLCVQPGQEAGRILIAAVVGALVFELVRRDGGQRSAEAVIVAAGCCLLVLIADRWAFAQWLCAQRVRGHYVRGIVMIGTNDDAVDAWTLLQAQRELGYEVRAVVGGPRSCPPWADLPTSEDVERIPELARTADATGVLVVANALSGKELHRVIAISAANNLHVQVCPALGGLAARRVHRVPMSGEAFFYVEPRRRPAWQLMAKRSVDLVGASVGALITAPLVLLACVAIRLDDRGPAFYRQVRIGSDGNRFVVYKLRTMALDDRTALDLTQLNERTDGPLFKSSQDPRVTRVGSILRALSIDELPQLYNVLTGTMSLVGPRPALPHEVEQFDAELLRRHSVRPGITGLWQLEARDNPSFYAYRRLDLLYVDNWSIGLDLWILLTTVPMVLAHALSSHDPQQEQSQSRVTSAVPAASLCSEDASWVEDPIAGRRNGRGR